MNDNRSLGINASEKSVEGILKIPKERKSVAENNFKTKDERKYFLTNEKQKLVFEDLCAKGK